MCARLTFTFAGVNSDDMGIFPMSKEIEFLPELRENTMIIPGRDGEEDFENNTYASRLINVQILLIASSQKERNEMWRRCAAWLSQKGKLIFSDEPDKYWYGRMYSPSAFKEMDVAAEFTFSFKAYPFAVGKQIDDAAVGTSPLRVAISSPGSAENKCCTIVIRNTGNVPITGLTLTHFINTKGE